GVFTHLATADEEDRSFTIRQLSEFENVLRSLKAGGFCPEQVHALNSGGLLQHEPGSTNTCRVGIALYGLSPSAHLAGKAHLRPALSLKTTVVAVKWVAKGATVSYGRTHTTKRRTQLAALPVG